VLANISVFVYYVSITGITGSASADTTVVGQAVSRIKRHTDLPVCVGFGIKTPAQAATIARVADAAVVGSALVQTIADSLDAQGRASAKTAEQALACVRALADGVRQARDSAPARPPSSKLAGRK